MTGADGTIPVHVKVPVAAWMPLAHRAQAAGFSSPTAYVQDMVTRFASVVTETDWVLFLHSSGKTNREIAEETGFTIHSIQARLARAGLRSNRASS